MKTRLTLDKFPGGALVQRGISDLRSNRHTVASCLVKIAHDRLSQAGLLPPKAKVGLNDPPSLEPELQLYRLLRAVGGDAYSRYNALLRELISFEQAFERTRNRASEPLASAVLGAGELMTARRASQGLNIQKRTIGGKTV